MNYLVTGLGGQSEALHGGKLGVEHWGDDRKHPEAVLVWRDDDNGSPGRWRKSWPLMTIRSWERADD